MVRILAVLITGALFMTACSDDSDEPGRSEVIAELESIWRSAGAGADAATRPGYNRRPANSDRCGDLEESDRWVGRGSNQLPRGVRTQEQIIEGVVSHYREEGGTEVRRYRSAASEERLVVVIDEERKISVELFVGASGDSTARVAYSPCGAQGSAEPKAPFEPEPLDG